MIMDLYFSTFNKSKVIIPLYFYYIISIRLASKFKFIGMK